MVYAAWAVRQEAGFALRSIAEVGHLLNDNIYAVWERLSLIQRDSIISEAYHMHR